MTHSDHREGVKLTKAQRAMLSALGAYGDEWVECFALYERRPAQTLSALGLIEMTETETSHFDARITPAGRAALTPNPEGAEQ